MKYLILLVCLSISCFALGQNRITVKNVDGKIVWECSINNTPVPCSKLDVKAEIPISIEDALPEPRTITVKDLKGQPAPTHINNATTINASEDAAIAYNITIIFADTDILNILNVGTDKTAKADPEQAKESDAPDNNCLCHGQNTKDRDDLNASIKKVEEEIEKAGDPQKPALLKKKNQLENNLRALNKAPWNTDIVAALNLCPDCGDKNFLVYDAHCKNLYKRINTNSFKRIKSLKDVSFRYKEEIKVKVIHINRYLKDVVITADDLMYKSEAPGLFDDFFGSSGQLMKGLRDAVKVHGGGIKTALDKLEKDITDFNLLVNKLKEKRDRAYSLCCEATANCGEVDLGTSFTDLNSRLFDLSVSYNSLNKELVAERDALKPTIKKVDDDIAKAALAEKPTLIQQKDELERKLKALEDQIQKTDALWTTFQKPTEEQLRNLVLFAKNYLKENYIFSTPPIYPLGNRLIIKINIDSKDDLKEIKERIIPTDHQALEIEGPVLNKWLFSFSSGPFIGFNDALYETTYQFQKIPSSGNQIDENSRFTLTPSGKTNPPVGLSALAHFENKFAENFGWGLSVGVGLTIETKPRPVYLFGPSFFIGDKNRFALTAGVAAMQVDVLKKDLYPDGLVYKNTEPLQYYKDLRMGGFVSLTYTLFTIESKNKQPKLTTTTTTPNK